VRGSAVGREGCAEGWDGAGLVAGSPGAGLGAGCPVDGLDGRDGSTGFQPSFSFVSQLPGRPGRGRYTLPSGPAYTLSAGRVAGRVAGCVVPGRDGRSPGREGWAGTG
jgi:hypothetical protein